MTITKHIKHIPTRLSILILLMHNAGHFCRGADETTNNLGRAYVIQLATSSVPEIATNYPEISCRNIYGICWRGKPEDNLKFARQMGHTHVMYQAGMEKSPLASNLFFLFESPEYQAYKFLKVERFVSLKKAYSEAQQTAYRKNFALKDAKAPFPNNLATGWAGVDAVSVEPDWQQQAVVDYFTAKIMELAHSTERPGKKFLFGGLAWDVPDLTGDFNAFKGNPPRRAQVTLAHWTGKDCAALAEGTTHEYSTYSDGKAAYYLKLKQLGRQEFPGRPLIYMVEPWRIYEEFVAPVEKRSDRDQLMADLFVTAEGGGTRALEFVDDTRIFQSGILARDHTGSTVPGDHDFAIIKQIAGKAAIHGEWFGWFGRFSSYEKPINNIYEIPHWEQLARELANWDNLNAVPLKNRIWDEQAYTSPNSGINENVVYSRQPKTQKLFAVFLNSSGSIPLKPGEKVLSIKRVDNFFCESEDGNVDLTVSGNKIIPVAGLFAK